ncbi:MAG: hypothetical protein II625_06765 [Bacilli bacterium]|nr:hypothetical protein [Bacilli bacterium]
MSKIENAIKVAKKMNTLIDFNLLSVPVLDDFILVQKNLTDPNNNIIFVAVKNNTLEQFLGDGMLEPNESFDDRIEKVINQMKEESKRSPLYEGNDEFLVYYKNYDNENFDFKIYVQDILTGTKDNLKFIRQMSAFFVEPKGNEFYQICMGAGAYAKSNKFKLLKDIKEYEKDEINIGLERNLKLIMDNLTYRD